MAITIGCRVKRRRLVQPLEAAYAHFERIEEDVPQAKR
jgi:hypothetical protein